MPTPSIPRPAVPEALLFDMDSTIADTEHLWDAALRRIAEEHGTGWDAEAADALIGATMDEGTTFLRDACGVALSAAQIDRLTLDTVCETIREGFDWMPGARELLAEAGAAGIPCALVTASFAPMAEIVLEQLPERAFAVVVTGEQVVQGKPHPEPYLSAIAQLGVPAERCLVLEDSVNGSTSGREAGCRVIAIPDMVPVAPSASLRVIESLAGRGIEELWALFDEVGADSAVSRG